MQSIKCSVSDDVWNHIFPYMVNKFLRNNSATCQSRKLLKSQMLCFLPSMTNSRVLNMIKFIHFDQCPKLERVVLLNTNYQWVNLELWENCDLTPETFLSIGAWDMFLSYTYTGFLYSHVMYQKKTSKKDSFFGVKEITF